MKLSTSEECREFLSRVGCTKVDSAIQRTVISTATEKEKSQ